MKHIAFWALVVAAMPVVAMANPLSGALEASAPCTVFADTPETRIAQVIRADMDVTGDDMTVRMEGRLECVNSATEERVRAVFVADMFMDIRNCVAIDAEIEIVEFGGEDPSALHRRLTETTARMFEGGCARLYR